MNYRVVECTSTGMCSLAECTGTRMTCSVHHLTNYYRVEPKWLLKFVANLIQPP